MPIKAYSSGMMMRQTFSVVTVVNSEILIVNEITEGNNFMVLTERKQRCYQVWQAIEQLVRSRPLRTAFTASFFSGVFIHFFALANFFVNHDSIVLPYNDLDWLLSQGKWFVTPLSSLEGPFVLNYLSMLIGLVAVSLCAGVLCKIFSIRSIWLARLIGVVMVAFPSVASIILYVSLDYFALAVLLAVLGAYFMMGDGWLNCLVGIGLVTLSLGAYQAFLGFALTILVLDCALRLAKKEDVGKVVRRGLAYIGMAIVCLSLYYLVLQLRLYMTGITLSDYKGISSMTSNLRPAVLLSSVVTAWENVMCFFLRDQLGMGLPGWYLPGILLMVLLVWSCLSVCRKSGALRSPIHLVLLAILMVIVLPLAVNIIGVLSANSSFYYISIYAFVLIPLAPLVFINDDPDSPQKTAVCFGGRVLSACAACLLAVTSYLWIVQDNTAYQKILQLNQQLTAKSAVLTAQIQSQPEYTSDTPVVLAGETPYVFLAPQGISSSFSSKNTSPMGLFGDASQEIYSSGVLAAYLSNEMGINLNIEDQTELLAAEYDAVEALPVYPDAGSITYLDEKIVVRLSKILPAQSGS